jgi:hypothetical protein
MTGGTKVLGAAVENAVVADEGRVGRATNMCRQTQLRAGGCGEDGRTHYMVRVVDSGAAGDVGNVGSRRRTALISLIVEGNRGGTAVAGLDDADAYNAVGTARRNAGMVQTARKTARRQHNPGIA